MEICVSIRLFATLNKFMPEFPDNYPITPGMAIRELLEKLKVPNTEAKLIFVNGVKQDLGFTLNGGERVGVFPPVGGG
ncbi:MAG: molybdopterin synthase sulfur carrier subunit [Desulfobacteraceae bacterium 4572_88]|nr:MAG: molybdopterin synthase sulfur carrier subunit [Desulfobacteraceae bacterium 4572_88]